MQYVARAYSARRDASTARDRALTLTSNRSEWQALLAAAHGALQRAEEIAGQDEAALWLELGLSRLASGSFDEAESLERAFSLWPEDDPLGLARGLLRAFTAWPISVIVQHFMETLDRAVSGYSFDEAAREAPETKNFNSADGKLTRETWAADPAAASCSRSGTGC